MRDADNIPTVYCVACEAHTEGDPIDCEVCKNTGRVSLPWIYEVCPRCDGHGTDRGASVECDGGGFTASEWAEQDDEFKEDYLAGRYDRPCGECRGKRVVAAPDPNTHPDLLARYEAEQRELAECEAIHAAERRMGA